MFVSVAQERQAEQTTQDAADATGSTAPRPGVLEFDDTSEFVRSITYTPAAPLSAPVKQEPIIVTIDTRAAREAGENSDEEMDDVEAITELEAGTPVKEEDGEEIDEDETSAMLKAIEDAIKKSEADSDTKAGPAESQDDATVRIIPLAT